MPHFGALEAGGTKMVCAIGTAQGEILERISIPTRSPEAAMPELLGFFQGKELAAIGIGSFGPVDLDRSSPDYGVIQASPKLDWRGFPILRRFEEALGIPVGIDTDVNAAALGEALWGCTRTVSDSIYVTVGTGVGLGVIINGKPHHGMFHPEGGHIPMERRADDPMVRGVCPYHANCLEGFASGPAIERRWGRKAGELADCAAVWDLEAYYIAQALCGYILTISPERIVLGGGVMRQAQMLPLVRKEVRRQMGGYLQGKGLERLDEYIVPASLGENQGVMGAIKLAMDAYAEGGGRL